MVLGAPVHHAVVLHEFNLEEPAAAGPAPAFAVPGVIHRAVRGTQQPARAVVEEVVGLPVQLHGHVGAAVEVSVRLALVADGEGPAGLARVVHVEGHALAAIDQIAAVAQRVKVVVGCGRHGVGLLRRVRSASRAVRPPNAPRSAAPGRGRRRARARRSSRPRSRSRRSPPSAGRAWCRRSSGCVRAPRRTRASVH